MAQSAAERAAMEQASRAHKEYMNEFIDKICSKANSKVISDEKYRQVITFLTQPNKPLEEYGIPHSQAAKFRWWVSTKKEFEMVTQANLNLFNVLCVPLPPKKQVGNRSCCYQFF